MALAARSAEPLEALARRLQGTAHPVDLADAAALDGFIARVEAEGGPLDVLVNNAGLELSAPIDGMRTDELERLVRVNLTAPMELCRQALPGMIARAQGHVVNVSSMAGVVAMPGMSAYGAAKAGSHFTALMQADLTGTGVGTTLVELGPVATEMLTVVNRYAPTRDAFARSHALKLVVTVTRGEVAAAVVKGVAKGARVVRLPRRAAPLAMLAGLPRALSPLVLKGVKHRVDR